MSELEKQVTSLRHEAGRVQQERQQHAIELKSEVLKKETEVKHFKAELEVKWVLTLPYTLKSLKRKQQIWSQDETESKRQVLELEAKMEAMKVHSTSLKT